MEKEKASQVRPTEVLAEEKGERTQGFALMRILDKHKELKESNPHLAGGASHKKRHSH